MWKFEDKVNELKNNLFIWLIFSKSNHCHYFSTKPGTTKVLAGKLELIKTIETMPEAIEEYGKLEVLYRLNNVPCEEWNGEKYFTSTEDLISRNDTFLLATNCHNKQEYIHLIRNRNDIDTNGNTIWGLYQIVEKDIPNPNLQKTMDLRRSLTKQRKSIIEKNEDIILNLDSEQLLLSKKQIIEVLLQKLDLTDADKNILNKIRRIKVI